MQPLPELVVVLLLHGGDHLALVLQLVGFLHAGHEERLHVLPGGGKNQSLIQASEVF